jgi:hypothetical protein
LNQPAGNQGSISFSSEQPMLLSKWDGNVKSYPGNNSA